MQGLWAPPGTAYTQAVHCAGFFCLIQKDLFLSTGHGGGSASLESIRNSHYCKQNRNWCNSDSTFFENARNIFNWYSKPFSASDQGGTVESEEYFRIVLLTESTLKILFYSSFFQIAPAQPMTIAVAAEGTGFAVFQVRNAVILAKDMLSGKVYFGSFVKHVNKNNLLKCLKSVPKHFTNWRMLWTKYCVNGHIHVIVYVQWPGLLSTAGWLTVLGHFHGPEPYQSSPVLLQKCSVHLQDKGLQWYLGRHKDQSKKGMWTRQKCLIGNAW